MITSDLYILSIRPGKKPQKVGIIGVCLLIPLLLNTGHHLSALLGVCVCVCIGKTAGVE